VGKELYEKSKDIPGIDGASVVSGFSMLSGAGSNYALAFFKLKPWNDRDKSQSVDSISAKLSGIAARISDADILFFSPPSVPGFSASAGFEMKLLDRSGGSFKDLDLATKDYLSKLMERPEIQYAQTSFTTNYP